MSTAPAISAAVRKSLGVLLIVGKGSTGARGLNGSDAIRCFGSKGILCLATLFPVLVNLKPAASRITSVVVLGGLGEYVFPAFRIGAIPAAGVPENRSGSTAFAAAAASISAAFAAAAASFPITFSPAFSPAFNRSFPRNSSPAFMAAFIPAFIIGPACSLRLVRFQIALIRSVSLFTGFCIKGSFFLLYLGFFNFVCIHTIV